MPQNRFRRQGFIQPQEPLAPKAPSALRRLLAGGVRVAGGLYPGGGPIGAGLASASEIAAQMAEEVGTDEGFSMSPSDWGRVGAEGTIGAVPLAKYLKGGKALLSALRTGTMSGGGEALREVARGEELDPMGIALAGGLGAATGGIFSKVLPESGVP